MSDLLQRLPPFEPHQVQVALTLTMLVATAVMALLCDVLRYRLWREGTATQAADPVPPTTPLLRSSIAPTLIPEDIRSKPKPRAVPQTIGARASRLAAALKQPRRTLSPGAQVAIARGRQAAQSPAAPSFGRVPAGLPAGFQSPDVLASLTAAKFEVTGLTVAIAIAQPSAERPASEVFRATLGSVLEPGDFAAPAGENEFILVVPNVQGAAAQRRLRGISQYLWDLQLRSLGQPGVSFQWGGLEVHQKPIGDAVKAAIARMQSAPRKAPAREPEAALRQAG